MSAFFNPQQVKNNRNGDTPKSSLRTDYIRNRFEAFGVEKHEFLCYPLQLMKVQLKNDLSAFSSSLLGLTGLSLLLFRSSSWTGFQDLPWWGLVLLGILCFALSLFIQMMLSIKMETNREAIIRTCAGLTLFILFGISLTVGHYLESAIMLAAGIAQFLVSPYLMINRLENIDLIKVITPALGFAGGFCLMLIGPQYEALDHSPFIILMIASFFTTALFGSISLFFPLNKYSNILFRLQAIPWLGWCVLLIPSTSIPNLIAPGMFAVTILFSGLIPWVRFALPEYDILGRGVLMVAGTLELTTLIFLSALLSLLDSPISTQPRYFVSAREAAFLFFILISIVLYYEVSTIVMTINGLMSELTEATDNPDVLGSETHSVKWNNRLARYLKPFKLTRDGMRSRLNSQVDQITALSRQLSAEKKRNAQLILLNELSQQLENQLDQPVSAQLAVNTLERAFNCALVSLYIHEGDNSFMLLAAAGPQTSMIAPGYRQNISVGTIGRAARQRKTQIINDIRLDSDYFFFENESNLSCVIVPVISNGHVNGVLVLNSEKINGFGSIEIGLAESVAEELTRAWERSGYHQRLTNLIQSGSHLASMVEPTTTAQEIAMITREILNARFTFVQIQLGQEGNFMQTASSGDALKLQASLKDISQGNTFIQSAFHAAQPFRVRDVRKYSATSKLVIDHPGLRSMIAIPIRWHRLSIGAILAFGKQNEVFFTVNDASLAELLSIQAASVFESTWLQQELRTSLSTTSLLYRLSTQIIQAENLYDAAVDIAQTAHKLAKGESAGIVLFSLENQVEAEVEIDSSGVHSGQNHPMETIRQVMESGQLIYMSQGQSTIRACLPIQTPIRKYGVLWMNIPEGQHHNPTNPADLQSLVNQSAIALERSLLLVESRQQAQEIKIAYDMLESTYDQTLAALTSALDARDRVTEVHSLRVSQLSAELGETLGFSRQQLKVLERGALLHV